MMIFVTVGTDLPFSRLIRHVDLWSSGNPEHRVFAQVGCVGPSDYVPKSIEWTKMVPADEFDRLYTEACLIIAHAGMGSIISALTFGKPIVILPRRAVLREHRNDHQLSTAERFADRPAVFVAWTEAELPDVIDQALRSANKPPDQRLPAYAPDEFTNRLRTFILRGVTAVRPAHDLVNKPLLRAG